ncbi:hypothetical protein AA313_de0202463 [Arthrobotrys entomopaga]|nr:hypothetical protein AA313_de0202463 [Arthrobotrys entomopaga]
MYTSFGFGFDFVGIGGGAFFFATAAAAAAKDADDALDANPFGVTVPEAGESAEYDLTDVEDCIFCIEGLIDPSDGLGQALPELIREVGLGGATLLSTESVEPVEYCLDIGILDGESTSV